MQYSKRISSGNWLCYKIKLWINALLYTNGNHILQKEEAKKLVRDAIAAGIFNDLGSGSNVDVCVITKDKVDYIRPFDEANLKGQR